MNLLGSGREFHVDLAYDVQEDAGGIAQAVYLAKNFVGYDKCVVILGDNIFEDDITPLPAKIGKNLTVLKCCWLIEWPKS